MRQRRKTRPFLNLGIGHQLAHHRLQGGGAQQHGFFPASRIQQTVRENMAALAIRADLCLVQRHEGPVAAIAPFDSEEEAVTMANDSIYGLAASVWTDNLSRACRVADRLQVGTVSVNTVDALSAMTPFGGMKQSGFGRDLSLHSLEKYTALKTTWIKYKA